VSAAIFVTIGKKVKPAASIMDCREGCIAKAIVYPAAFKALASGISG
jgi:hypothetical protein